MASSRAEAFFDLPDVLNWPEFNVSRVPVIMLESSLAFVTARPSLALISFIGSLLISILSSLSTKWVKTLVWYGHFLVLLLRCF